MVLDEGMVTAVTNMLRALVDDFRATARLNVEDSEQRKR